MIPIWVGDFGTYQVPDKFKSARIRKDGWPDQRFSLGREMATYFKAIDK